MAKDGIRSITTGEADVAAAQDVGSMRASGIAVLAPLV
jgi:hypothetical protein